MAEWQDIHKIFPSRGNIHDLEDLVSRLQDPYAMGELSQAIRIIINEIAYLKDRVKELESKDE